MYIYTYIHIQLISFDSTSGMLAFASSSSEEGPAIGGRLAPAGITRLHSGTRFTSIGYELYSNSKFD